MVPASTESPEWGLFVPADANHIIHACTHPAWRDEAFTSEGEMFEEMHAYLERLFKVCRWGWPAGCRGCCMKFEAAQTPQAACLEVFRWAWVSRSVHCWVCQQGAMAAA